MPENPEGLCPPHYRDRILVHTVHDGAMLPREFRESPALQRLEQDGTLWQHFVRERDWGANMVAERIAHVLGLAGYYRVNVARVLLDFNRFPGSSNPSARPLDRMAIIHPCSEVLSHNQKRHLLEAYYDRISTGMEQALEGKLLFLSIHTYDEHNSTRTQRPEVSLLTRALSYQQSSQLPYNTFDPLFPDVLTESSANRILRDRVALTLEKAGLDVEHNYPYCLPDGSLEIRCQPWLFFREVRRRFVAEHPDVGGDEAFALVWSMLLNTNLRLAAADALSGYLHRFRRAPVGNESFFLAAAAAYQRVRDFVCERPEMIEEYRSSPERTSALGVEVRKDLVWQLEGPEPIAPRPDEARTIGEKLALGVAEYLRGDRE